jgi:hypothetical protein
MPSRVGAVINTEKKREAPSGCEGAPLLYSSLLCDKRARGFVRVNLIFSGRLRIGLLFLLHQGDDAKQPCAQGGFQFFFRAPLIKRVYGFAAAG